MRENTLINVLALFFLILRKETKNFYHGSKKFINFYKLSFYFWLLFIFLVSIYPGNLINLVLIGDPTTHPGGDKVSHFLTYFVLGVLFNLSYKKNSFLKL